MANTVRMTRDGKFCDIFDSPETIANAKAEGWEPYVEKPKAEPKPEQKQVKKEEKKADLKPEKKPAKKGKR